MPTLSPITRFVLYKKALEYLENALQKEFYLHGICFAIMKHTRPKEPSPYGRASIEKYYPELTKYIPKDGVDGYGDYWFPLNKDGLLLRITILKNVIAEMEKELA
jgi:hypothetical protein